MQSGKLCAGLLQNQNSERLYGSDNLVPAVAKCLKSARGAEVKNVNTVEDQAVYLSVFIDN